MKELEEVNCEIRRVIDFQLSTSDRLNSLEPDDNGPSNGSHGYDNPDNPCGGFFSDAAYAWLSYGCHLVVLKVRTGEHISSWTFRGKVTSVCQFPVQPGELPLLLVGLDNGATRIRDSMGLLCIFECSTSRVLRAIKMPAGVEQVCVVSGGAEWEEFNDKRPDSILTDMDGIACLALRNLHHVMVDLQRTTWEISDTSTLLDEHSPAEIELLTTKGPMLRTHSNKDKHAAYNLLNSRIEKHIGFNRSEFESAAFLEESLTSAIISSTKIGCLISGCLGRVIMWQNDGSVGWISLPVDESMIVTHLALLEPTDDPRPFYYLWVVYQDDEAKAPPLLRMYALLFERKYCERGTNLYFNLEAEPSLKFEFELDRQDKIVSLSTIERETNPDHTESGAKRGEDNLLLISTSDRTLLFDLNQWYKEQMPQTIGECQNPNSILASYRTKPQMHISTENPTISCAYLPYTLREFPSNSPNPPEELFYPNSFALEWLELSLTKLTFWMTRGIQVELLREMAIAGPIILTQPAETFHKCLSIGLVPFNSEFSFSSDQNAQREMLLSLCLEQRWSTFLVRCAKEWSDGSASYLYPSFLKWGAQRASSIKMIADRVCVPLFDQSGNSIGESEVKTLRFCSQQLECLSNVVAKLPLETSDLVKQRRALKRVSTYLQVLLWFYDVGLLPESQDLEDGPLTISLALKVPYPFEKLFSRYKEKRESIRGYEEGDENEEGLFIDELINRECPVLKLQWEREANDASVNGFYPPPSLQSLLRSYLIDCHQTELCEIECKHQITIYLLMDLAMLLQGTYPGVDQLIKYPSAFKMSPSLIKLTQAFWLLDHEDYQGFLDMMTGQLVLDSDVKDWHHKLVLRTLVRNNQHKLALTYLRIRKPPLSSVEDQSTLISLSVEHGLVQSAFHRRPHSHYAQLLVSFFQACKTYGKLSDILHLALDSEEEEVFVRFLEEDKSEDMRLLYYLQRCRYTEANGKSIVQTNCPRNAQTVSTSMLNAYNATLPDVVKRFTINMAKTSLDVDLESRYPRPMSHYKSRGKTLGIYETVIKKAKETYLRGEKYQIPFISAPCVSLRANDNRANANCVLFPKLAQKSRGKRTLDEVYDDEESRMRTPDAIKRRRLLDDGDTSNASDTRETGLGVAFNTPLVKRKVNATGAKDTPSETPHSILKIRQLIRSSTSPSLGTLQAEVTDSPSAEKEKKVSRQIRFNIGQAKKNIPREGEEVVEEEPAKTNMSVESEDAFYSPNISSKSNSESTLLSDSSYTSKHVYSPRPRPSLRRTCLQSSKESLHEMSNTFSRTRSSNSPPRRSPAASDNSAEMSKICKTPPRTPRAQNSALSASIYSPSILSRNSSFDFDMSTRKFEEASLRHSIKFSTEQDVNYNCAVSSTPLIKGGIVEQPFDDEEKMDIDANDEEDDERSVHYENHYDTKRRAQLNLAEKEAANNSKRETSRKYKNGDVTKGETLDLEEFRYKELDTSEVTKEDSAVIHNDDNEDAFESLSTTSEGVLPQTEKRSRLAWSYQSKTEKQREVKTTVRECVNGESYDITDDESSNSTDLQDVVKSKNLSKEHVDAMSTRTDNVYDMSNITDDESESSRDAHSSKARTVASEDTQREADTSVFEDCNEFVLRYDTKEDSPEVSPKAFEHESSKNVTSSVKNDLRKPASKRSSLRTEPQINQSISSKEQADLIEESSVRMTRSRRASSVTKDSVALLSANSPSKVATPEKSRSTRRTSSLAKEVLTASIGVTNDENKRTGSSGSEDSLGTSSPRKTRTRRASSVAKDTSLLEEDAEPKTPVRRSTRRASSVQKELPEIPKTLTKRNRVSSSSSLTIGVEEEKVQSTSKNSRARNSASESKKSSAASSTRGTRSSKASEEEVEEAEVKPTRRRGSSVPKESVTETVRTRRSSSVAKEIIPEDFELQLENLKGKHSLRATEATSSPAANTRSRRSSIQSVPEELEEVLNLPSMERISNVSEKKQSAQNASRQKRASSVDLLQSDTKRRTRGVRGRSVLKETIAEEPSEIEQQVEKEAASTRKVPTRRKRTTSESNIEDQKETVVVKTRRNPKPSHHTEDQFSFSQPEKTGDLPMDQKAIGEVPNYIFSPPHTRSKRVAPDQHRRKMSFIPMLSEEDVTQQTMGMEYIAQKSLEVPKSGNYVRAAVSSYESRVRVKFVVPRRSRNVTD